LPGHKKARHDFARRLQEDSVIPLGEFAEIDSQSILPKHLTFDTVSDL
jgi:hypothetical protein